MNREISVPGDRTVGSCWTRQFSQPLLMRASLPHAPWPVTQLEPLFYPDPQVTGQLHVSTYRDSVGPQDHI